MKFVRVIAIVCAGAFLAACSHDVPPVQVQTVTKTVYPILPTLTAPADPQMLPVKWDYPRLNETEIKNISACLAMDPAKKDTEEYKRKCDIRQIDAKSNLWIGLDQKNLKNLIVNQQRRDATQEEWKALLRTYSGVKQTYDERNGIKGTKVTPVKPKKKVTTKPAAKPTVTQRVIKAVTPKPKPKPLVKPEETSGPNVVPDTSVNGVGASPPRKKKK